MSTVRGVVYLEKWFTNFSYSNLCYQWPGTNSLLQNATETTSQATGYKLCDST